MVDPRRRQNRPRDTAAGGQDRPQQAKSAKPESEAAEQAYAGRAGAGTPSEAPVPAEAEA